MKTPATPATVRLMNRRAIIRQLLHVPVLSRAELAKAVGLSPVTAGKIVEDLTHTHILEAVEATAHASRVGRPGNLVQLNRTQPRFLVIQMGVTHTRASLIPLGFTGHDAWQVQMETPDSAASWIAQLAKASAPQLAADLWGIIISAPGIVDHAAGRVLFSPNLHWSENHDFTALFKPYSAAPVLLTQEIQALAMGELTTHPEAKDFLLVDFSHGLGGAAIIGGDVHKTPLPLNSELGHSRVIGNARPCGCGAIGCVETLVSRRGLFQSLHKPRAPYQWETVIKHIQTHGLEPWLKDSLDAAAAAIGSALNILGLRQVIITGSINELPPAIGQYLADEIRAASLWARFGSVTVQFAPRHRMRGLIKAGLESIVLSKPPR